ncbi:LOW QUALITY PROTEIN: Bud13 homolog [Plakobranchus ocellatus]|uniref:BUD13 homolog n=1 Tax=Plakobranchus ocellatus TaxID=259542 RepID=A0AAV3ZZH8_9GAST|nr:LOW QUALITY PROTEIN: Bud13 homolog [Plakobranchus ocellatus]
MAALSKAEYLKRYMSKDQLPKEDRKKKRRKVKPSANSRLKIIDDDADFKRKDKDGPEVLEEEEEAPFVAEVIDERPKHVQQLEAYRKNSRWKILGQEREDKSAAMDYGVIERSSPSPITSQSRGSPPQRKRHDSSDSDSGPPRRKRHDSSSGSDKTSVTRAPIKRENSEARSKAAIRYDTDSDADVSPPRKNRQSRADSDNSPPRRLSPSAAQSSHRFTSRDPHSSQQNSKTTDHKLKPFSSPSRNRPLRHDSDSDLSPSRSRIEQPDSDQSPVRKRKGGSDSDQSPVRKSKGGSDSDQSPVRKRKGGSDSDQSPVRKRKGGSDSDQSPPRKRRSEESTQSKESRKRHDSDSDPSPPRKKRPQSSPPRSKKKEAVSNNHKRPRKSRFDDSSADEKPQKATKTLGGAKAGLSSAREMKEEARKLREKEEKSFQNIDEETLGRNAKTVMRDKETGKRRNLQAESEKNAEEDRKKEEQMKKYAAWGKGVKQAKDRESTLQDQIHEAMKPLARYSDDADLDEMRRQEERAEDPMLAYIQKRRKKEEEKAGVKKKKELPRYKGPAPPPNRFNIMPGYRWDGVDRSNGFEKKIFAHRANKTAIKEMAYKWSTEDM